MDLACREQCEVADPCQLPSPWPNPTGVNTGAGASPSNPLYIAQAGDDTNIAELDATANATPGVWTELFPASATRQGAAIQNKDAAAIVFVLEAATAPANGTQPGEIGVPVFPGYYEFDWVPKKRYFFRSTVASSKVAVKTW